MALELWTTHLGKHKGSKLGHGHSELLTLAPGQSTSPGSLVLVDTAGAIPKAETIKFRVEPAGALEVRLGSRQAAGFDVTVHAKGLGMAEIYVKADLVGVITIGNHVSHLGVRAVDLLARASNGPDARKIVAIQQILQNRKAPIIDQKTGAYGSEDQLVCGTVAQRAGISLFGSVEPAVSSYHQKITSRRPSPMEWDDLHYDPKVTARAVERIRALLDRGSAVRLGMAYRPAWNMLAPNGALQPEREGGHTILVVGYVDDVFLYLDPFPQGSRLRYLGGLPFNYKQACDYLGVLGISQQRGMHLESIVVKPLEGKLGPMEVISGP